MSALCAYSFPGNVRELQNICHWLTVMAPAQVVEVKDLPEEVRANQPAPPRTASAAAAVAINVDADELARARNTTREAAASSDEESTSVAAVAHGLSNWDELLMLVASQMLARQQPEVMQQLARQFESVVIKAALAHTKGRRIEAAQKLGIGRNTITRKIQELNLDAED
jgi:two-component system nitrogen regulation response regulator GlnG